eukprot:TRINITY_DN27464_c0_g1_i1.p1 TRINITY_DN27464_c0_g1~~TRINITY_DN27464_c0_g1_i1.p1  ORF type:complete len:790 (-),score=104.87 TRINITY_DN27464_c0_g1_i1:344-2713(-)
MTATSKALGTANDLSCHVGPDIPAMTGTVSLPYSLDHCACATCCVSLPLSSFPSRSGNRIKQKLTHGRLVCNSCIEMHFNETLSVGAASPSSLQGAREIRANTASESSSTASPGLIIAASPLLSTSRSPPSHASIGHGTHAHEVKSLRLKTTKKQLREYAGGKHGKGNLLFVDLLHWLKDIADAPFDQLTAFVEDMSLPYLCRLALWGLPCPGCQFAHSKQLQLWRSRPASKPPSWMRSPHSLPGLQEVPLMVVDAHWRDAPEECKSSAGDRVQFVALHGVVIWGRDLGDDSREMFDAFVADLQRDLPALDGFTLPPSAVDEHIVDVSCCPQDGWHRILSFLDVSASARAAIALLSNKAMQGSIGSAWDPTVLLSEAWPDGLHGLLQFLPCAHAMYFAAQVFSVTCPPHLRCQAELIGMQLLEQTKILHPRSAVLPSAPTALALSGGSRFWEGILAVAFEREVKLIRRYDMKGCGTISLRDRREVAAMTLNSDGRTLAVVPVGTCEVHFFTTEAKTPPVTVALKCSGVVAGAHFLHGSPVDDHVAVACGSQLSKVSAEAGAVVSFWCPACDRPPFTDSRTIGMNEVITVASNLVELWDVRTPQGVVSHLQGEGLVFTAFDVSAVDFNSSCSPSAYLGDGTGSLHRVDWRAPSLELLWKPQQQLSKEAPFALLADRCGVCFLSPSWTTMVALKPSITLLGSHSMTHCISSTTSGVGAWAVGCVPDSSFARRAKPSVYILESLPGARRIAKADCKAADGPRKATKMFRKSEDNSHAGHTRGSVKSSRSVRR